MPQDEMGLLDLDSWLGVPQPDTLIYCCGPEPLLAAVEERCRAWPPRSLHVERFSARPLSAPVRAEALERHTHGILGVAGGGEDCAEVIADLGQALDS